MPEWFEKVTIGNLLDRLAQRCGEREALAFAGQRWSFQQLQADSDRAARGLMQCGIAARGQGSLMAHEPPRVAAHFVCRRQDWRGPGPD